MNGWIGAAVGRAKVVSTDRNNRNLGNSQVRGGRIYTAMCILPWLSVCLPKNVKQDLRQTFGQVFCASALGLNVHAVSIVFSFSLARLRRTTTLGIRCGILDAHFVIDGKVVKLSVDDRKTEKTRCRMPIKNVRKLV
jgi:hypothetical protein